MIATRIRLPFLIQRMAIATAANVEKRMPAKYQPRPPVDKRNKKDSSADKGFMTDFIRNRLSPAYFTGRPEYFDNMKAIEQLLTTHESTLMSLEATDSATEGNERSSTQRWLSKSQLEDLWNARLTGTEYQSIMDQLNRLVKLEGLVVDPVLRQLLGRFRASELNGARQKVRQMALDENGCSYALGYRRRVRAHVWMSECQEPGEGRVIIDGEDYTRVLER
jgi:hypothetical protein